jgi:hypothetical protein
MNKLLLNGVLVIILSNSSFAYDQKTASKCPVTHDKYMTVKLGMSYDEAVKIIGCEGDEQNRRGSTDYSYDWRVTPNTISLEFLNQKLWQKNFYTDKYPAQADCMNITPGAYADIKIGMSYADTVTILKCDGFEHNSVNRNDGLFVQYRWTAPNGRSWIQAQFTNDKLEYKGKYIEK